MLFEISTLACQHVFSRRRVFDLDDSPSVAYTKFAECFTGAQAISEESAPVGLEFAVGSDARNARLSKQA